MCGTFPDTSAQWVWVPATMAFLFRVIDWRTTGSVLTGPGSLVEHFFTANCQIQNYSEAGFATRCFDKLFVTPLWIGTLAYSAGAVIHRASAPRHSLGHESALRTTTITRRSRIVTTRFGALLAILVTGSSLGFRFHTKTAETYSWTLFGSSVWPNWANVLLNIAIWGGICLIGIGFIRAPLPKTEKAMFGSYTGNAMLVLVGGLFPRIGGTTQVLQTLLSLTAFLAALAILVSFWNKQAPSESS